VNAISFSRHFAESCPFAEQEFADVYDLDGCIRVWGKRGILSGGLIGLVLGALFVANPFTANALTFGIAGTLIVCAIECAVVAGAFAATLAALHGQGIRRSSAIGFESRLGE
jgi:hypothetical protein